MLLRAARYLGVPPWELIAQEMAWIKLALESEGAEHHAERKQMEKQKRQSKRRS